MRRFEIAVVLGLLLLTGGARTLWASDTPKPPRTGKPAAKRKAVPPKAVSKTDAGLENLYVDAEIGEVFTVNLGRPGQELAGDSSGGSAGAVQVYQLSSREMEQPPAEEVTGPSDPAAEAWSDEESGELGVEAEAAPAGDEGEGEMAPAEAEEDPSASPAEEPAAAAEAPAAPTDPAAPAADPKTDPKTGKPGAAKAAASAKAPAAAKDSPPPHPPAPPPIR